MAQAGVLEVVITATTTGLTAGINNAREAINKAGPAFLKLGTILSGAVVAGLTTSVVAFGQAQKSAQGLATSLANQGVTSQAALRDILNYSSELQNMSGISDESIQDASALISRFGATGEELK